LRKFFSERKIAGLFVGFERKKCSLSIKIAGLSADFFWKKSQNLEQVLIECKKEIKKNSTDY